MVPVLRSLEQISTGHTVFERDQVLTHDQLNSLAGYADDQARLTRVRLLGVGVVCGLRPSLSGSTVTVTRGLGVTTDGDLLHLDADTVFDRFREYDETYPAYPPLYAGGDPEGEMVPAFELVAQGVADDRARSLGELAAAGTALADTVAVLLMESYVRDDDLCSGTDCDNLGREAVNTPKLLLVRRGDAGPLREAIATPGDAWAELEEVVADRPTFGASIDTPAELGAAFRTACANTSARLEAALPRLFSAAGAFLGDAVGAGSGAAWSGRLAALRGSFAGTHVGIQYWYGFLKDVAETYNELRERLFGDRTVCSPPVDAFPKHLLLGDVSPGADLDANRTGFYPSPLAGRSAGELEHARFLARRLGALLDGFRLSPSANAPIRVTPSAFEDRPLEERAIPFYYAPDADDPVHRRWSYRLSRRGMDEFVYAYHAASWGAKGAAANPLASQIGRFPFFRVEGHVGRPVEGAVDAIEAEIRARNLPFAVRSVLVGTDRGRVVRKPGIRVTDLHRFHHLLRRDVARQLDDVEQFSGRFRGSVDAAVQAGKVDNATPTQGVPLTQVAADRDASVKSMTQAARAPLQGGYAAYRAAPSWQQSVNTLLSTAGQYKAELGSVVKTDFTTPFDTLIASTQIEWLPWLDQILDAREEKEDERLLFAKFLEEHPGIEHFGGVCRGGTLVLVYDEGGTVIADFMLSYHAPEPEREEEPEEPTLEPPVVRPPYIVDEGIRIIPQLDRFFDDRIFVFERDVVDPLVNQKFDFQTQYLDLFKQTYTDVFRSSLDVIKGTDLKAGTVDLVDKYSDPALGLMMEESRLEKQRLDMLTEQAAKPNVTPEEKQFLDRQILVAQEDLAKTSERITDYVSEAGVEVKTGSEGFQAVMEVSENMAKISEGAVLDATKTNLGKVMDSTANVGLKTMLGGMLQF